MYENLRDRGGVITVHCKIELNRQYTLPGQWRKPNLITGNYLTLNPPIALKAVFMKIKERGRALNYIKANREIDRTQITALELRQRKKHLTNQIKTRPSLVNKDFPTFTRPVQSTTPNYAKRSRRSPINIFGCPSRRARPRGRG